MTDKIILLLCYGVMYAAFNAWTEKSIWGIAFKKYLQEWRADGWVHGVMVSVSVYIAACCGILGLALTLEAIGL